MPVFMQRKAAGETVIAKTRVLDRRQLTPTTVNIRIEKPRGFDYAPVQFVGLELETDEGDMEYSMSLASSPTRPHLEFGARVASGSAWKRAFAALSPGDVVEIDGPYGHFILDETRSAVMIAGGIGITPLKGMIEYATDRALPIHVALLYGNRSEEEVAYRAELDEAASANGHLRIVHTLTRPSPAWAGRRGRIDAALLREHLAPGAAYYVCGLPEMVRDVATALLELGVPRADVKWELFHGYE